MAADDLELDDQLCFAVYAATNAITRAYRPLLKRLGLTYPQYLVMMLLWRHKHLSARDIALRLELPPNAISPLLERMESSGLIERRRDMRDRRVVHVSATAKGLQLEAAATKVQKTIVCRTALSPERIDRLRDELRQLARQMSRAETRISSCCIDEPAPDDDESTR